MTASAGSNPIYSFAVKAIDGKEKTLAEYAGKVLLIVNVASKCGFTPQYKGLQALYEKYGNRGFAVLGFPCDQFGGQEPGDPNEIQNFCSLNFGVTFPLFAKGDVNGPHAQPLFEHLKKSGKGILGTEAIKWNFTKFLISRDGQVIQRFAPNAAPESLETDIEKQLAVAAR